MIGEENISKDFEEKLYKFYNQLDELERTKARIELLQRQIKEIEEDIWTTNISLDTERNMGIDYSTPRVQSSGKCSPQESDLIGEIERLERELLNKRKEINALRAEIRQLESDTADMRYNIYYSPQKLSDEARKLVEARYKHKKSLREIAETLYQSKSNVDYVSKKIIDSIVVWDKYK